MPAKFALSYITDFLLFHITPEHTDWGEKTVLVNTLKGNNWVAMDTVDVTVIV